MAGQLKANHETWGSTVVELHTKAPKKNQNIWYEANVVTTITMV
jgi:hypothetical protein